MPLNFGEEEGGSLFAHNRSFDEGVNQRGIRPGGSTVVLALDGSGDAETLQEAFAMLPSSGGEIFIKEGTHKIPGQININHDNVSIKGTGRGTILDCEVGTAIRVDGPDYFTIENLRMKCDEERTYAIWLTNSAGSSIRNCWFDGDFASAIFITGTNNEMNILNNFITGTNEPSITMAGLTDIRISNNSFDNGIINTGTISDFIISNNIVRNQNEDGVGIALTGATNGIITGNFVEDEGVNGTDGIGLASACDNNVITGNRCVGWLDGINIANANCDKNLVGHNQLIGNTAALTDNGTNTLDSNNIVA